MLLLHHLENSRSQRIIWLLEELELEYDIRCYQREQSTLLAADALKDAHPLGKAPILEADGLILAESGAIMTYLVEKHGEDRLIPPLGTPEYQRYIYWLHYAEGSFYPLLFVQQIFNKIEGRPMPFFAKPIAKKIVERVSESYIQPQIKLNFEYLEAELESSEWFSGKQFTAADIQMAYPLEVATVRGGLDERYPNLLSFLKNFRSRPAYQTAIARGGSFQILS